MNELRCRFDELFAEEGRIAVDDDGDLFRQSYEEISRPTNDRLFAREQRVLDDLRAENAVPKNLEAWELNYPVSQGWSYERIRN